MSGSAAMEAGAEGGAEGGALRGHVRLLCAAAVLHLALCAAVYGVGRYGLFPGTFDANGIAVTFASDGARYRSDATALSEVLWAGELRYWAVADRPFHVKLYSVCFAVFGPWLGFNVLGAAPLNALYYLATLVLVFGLGREVFDRRAGLLAAGAVALWPSFLLHTTQFLKDPLFVAETLALVLVMVRWLTRAPSWGGALLTAFAGGLVATVLWLTRSDMGEVLYATVLLGAAAVAAGQLLERRLRAANLVGMALLVVVTLGVPRVIPGALEPGGRTAAEKLKARRGKVAGPPATTEGAAQGGIWSGAAARVGTVRQGFIKTYADSGSNIDKDVQINSPADLFGYLPRAAAVGFFAPFPGMWLAPGKVVGSGGRLLGGLESLAMYVVEGLALVGLWRGRRRVAAWLLLSVAAMGMTALGLVVINVGTLFRLRYVFLMLLVVLAAGGAARILGRLTGGPREGGERGLEG
jgi:hypothetical protein